MSFINKTDYKIFLLREHFTSFISISLSLAHLRALGMTPEPLLHILTENLQMDRDLEEFRVGFHKLREQRRTSTKVVVGEKELVEAINQGCELIRELNDGDKFLVKKAQPVRARIVDYA